MLAISPEQPSDETDIEELLDLAFGPDRHRKTSYRYRRTAAPVPYLCMLIRDRGRLVGSIRYWPVSVGPARTPALLLGPLAVAPDRQGTGVGAALMNHSLAVARDAGHRLVFLVGDVAYYSRFGFSHVGDGGVFMPGEKQERLLYRDLASGALGEAAGPIEPVVETRAGGSAPNLVSKSAMV